MQQKINNKQKKGEVNIRSVVNLPGGSGKKIKVAVLGIGYADGISRVLSNKGHVYFKKKTFKIIENKSKI